MRKEDSPAAHVSRALFPEFAMRADRFVEFKLKAQLAVILMYILREDPAPELFTLSREILYAPNSLLSRATEDQLAEAVNVEAADFAPRFCQILYCSEKKNIWEEFLASVIDVDENGGFERLLKIMGRMTIEGTIMSFYRALISSFPQKIQYSIDNGYEGAAKTFASILGPEIICSLHRKGTLTDEAVAALISMKEAEAQGAGAARELFGLIDDDNKIEKILDSLREIAETKSEAEPGAR